MPDFSRGTIVVSFFLGVIGVILSVSLLILVVDGRDIPPALIALHGAIVGALLTLLPGMPDR